MGKCPSSIFGEAFTHGEKVCPNIAEEDDELAGKRAAAVQEFLDFFFLSLFLFSHTYIGLHCRARPCRAAR